MEKKRSILIAIVVFLASLIITGSSYAFWSWNSSINKNIVFNTANDIKDYIIYNEGESAFIGDLNVSNSYQTGSIHSTISVYKTNAVNNLDLYATIHMDVNQIGDNMKLSSALKWVVTAGTTSSVGAVLGQGNFIGANAGDTLTLVPDITVTTTETFYTIWIWLDANEHPSDYLSGEVLDTNVWTEINQIEGSEDRYEITRKVVNYQKVSATVVDSKYKVVSYKITNTNTEPNEWTSISNSNQANVYTLNETVNATGTYYIWFKDAIDRVVSTSVNVTTVDNSAPSCTWGTFNPSQIQNGETSIITLTCTDSESNISIYNLTTNDITLTGNSVTITNMTRSTITNGYQYTLTVTGTSNDGTSSLTLPANKVNNGVGVFNASVTSGNVTVSNAYTVNYLSANSCTLDSTIYASTSKIYGTPFNIANPSCTGYTFTGWTASNTLDTTNAKYGNTSDNVTTTWSNASTPTNATWFKDLALTSNKTISLMANWVDDVAPTGTLSLSGTNNAVTATLSNVFDATGISEYQYLIQTTSTCPSSGYTSSNDSSYTFNITTGGTHYICARMVDTLGNISEPLSSSVDFTNITYSSGNLLYGLDNISNIVAEGITYSINNSTVTVTSSTDDGYGFTNAKVYLEANKTYYFNCNSNGTWGETAGSDTVEAFLMLNGAYNTWIRMDGTTDFAFTPTVSGEYWLRLDVNQNGQTYTFSNIRIEEKLIQNMVTSGTLGTLPTMSINGETNSDWYTAESGGTQITSSTTIPNVDTTYYAHLVTITYDYNYLPNDIYGGYSTNLDYYYGSTTNILSKTTSADSSAKNGKVIELTMDNGSSGGPYFNNGSLTAGHTYTYSVYIKADHDRQLWFGHEQNGIQTINVTTTWQRFTYTFTAGNSQYNSMVFFQYGTSWASGDKIYIHSLEIQESDSLNVKRFKKVAGSTLGTLPTTNRGSSYTFGNWYTTELGGTQVTSSTTVPSSNTTYYAHWQFTPPATPTMLAWKATAGDTLSSGTWSNEWISYRLTANSANTSSIQYCVDTTNTCTPNTTFSTDQHIESSSYIRYRAVATDGYYSEIGSYNGLIDNVRPTVSYNLAAGTYITSKTITVTASDTGGSGFAWLNVHVYKDGSFVEAKSVSWLTNSSFSVNLDSEGTWTIYAGTSDYAGNQQNQSPDNGSGWYYQTYTLVLNDVVAPSSNITTTSNLKVASQTATLSCTDDLFGVTKYYWGTSSSPADSAYTSVTSTTSFSTTASVSSAGTYYLFCKDAAGNVSTSTSKTYHTYKVNNMFQNVTGSTYTTTDYTQASTATYLAPSGTSLTLASIYTIPNHSRSGRFKGYSVGAASTTDATIVSTSEAPTLTANSTYSMWFTRNMIYFKYQKQSNETLLAQTKNSAGTNTYTWSTDSNNYITRSTNGGTATNNFTSYRYGVTSIDLANWNSTTAINLRRQGYIAKSGAQWKCVSGCASGVSTFSHASTTISNTDTELCSTTSADCTIVVKVNWQSSSDTTAPTISISPGSTWYYCNTSATSVSVTTSASDTGGSSLNHIEVVVWQDPTGTGTGTPTVNSSYGGIYSSTYTFSLTRGAWIVGVIAYDNAGNVSSTSPTNDIGMTYRTFGIGPNINGC